MKITLCGSMKFNDKFLELQKELEALGHTVLMPIAVPGVDYWAEDGAKRQEAKKALRLVEKHLDKISESEAILVANYTKGEKRIPGASQEVVDGFDQRVRSERLELRKTLRDNSGAKRTEISARSTAPVKEKPSYNLNSTGTVIENYIGANSFLEMGYAKYKGKKIFLLNPLPNQPYIHDELVSFEPLVLNGDLSLIV